MRQKNAILYLLYPVDVLHMYIYILCFIYVCFPQKVFPTCFSQQSPEKHRWRPRCATSSWKSSRRTIAWNRSASTSAAWRRHATMAPRGAPVKAMKRWGVHWEKQGTIWGFTGKSETCDGFSKIDQLISWFLDGGTVCETMSVSISVA